MKSYSNVNSLLGPGNSFCGERVKCITMLVFVSASGSTIPPIFVFPCKKPNPNLLLGTVVWSLLGLYHESGWVTGGNFPESLIHFQYHLKATKKDPVLQLMVIHSSRLEFPCVKFAKENGIILLTFPALFRQTATSWRFSVFPIQAGIGTQPKWVITS